MATLTIAMAVPSVSSAQPERLVLPVAKGRKVSITFIDGRTVKDKMAVATPGTIGLASGIRVQMKDVQRVKVSDSVWDGAGKGASSCLLVGALIGVVADSWSQDWGNQQTSYVFIGALAGTAIGGGIGVALDALHKTTVYERRDYPMTLSVRPLLLNRGTGVGIRLRW